MVMKAAVLMLAVVVVAGLALPVQWLEFEQATRSQPPKSFSSLGGVYKFCSKS